VTYYDDIVVTSHRCR